MPFDSQLQRRILGRFATGVTVVTTGKPGSYSAMTANAVASLSLDPPLLLVAVDKKAHMHGELQNHRYFAANVLTETQEALSRRFAMKGAKEFADLALKIAETGAPIFADALAFLDCKVVDILPGGDHDIFIGEIVAGDAKDGKPLLYYCGKYARLPD